MRNDRSFHLIFLAVVLLAGGTRAQERSHYQYWLELAAADQTYADRALEIGRSQAFLEFLGEGSVNFREEGPVDALEEYSSPDFRGNDLTWESHYIDVSRAGDLGLSAGPMVTSLRMTIVMPIALVILSRFGGSRLENGNLRLTCSLLSPDFCH